MRNLPLHEWNLTPQQAMQVQQRLRDLVVLEDALPEIRVVVGADVSVGRTGEQGLGAVIAYTFPALEEIERRTARAALAFPYVPGLLAFREAPVLLKALERLRVDPDVILLDAHGLSHPRRMGLACHMGVLLNKPTIGCAKSRLVGEFEEPGPRRGDRAPLRVGTEVVGAALRTRDNVRPIFVSQGHMVSLPSAVRIALACCDSYRIPKPTREADRLSRQLRMRGTP